jgi:serine/threonine-protein kinase
MAEVWRAMVSGMAGFHREVVIKTMRPELAVSEDLVRMFINEARIAARLNHPGIMQVFDFGQLDARYFIAMEFVPGRTLRQLARALRQTGRTLPRRFVVRLLMETARALGYGHALMEGGRPLGFAHRDVSPENIMVSTEGSAKLIDFGAAVTRELPPPMNTFVGKYRYLPPERLEGAIGDSRADVYSLGIVAYEYLTGRRPYDGPQIKKAILRGDAPDPCRVVPSLPRRLGGLIVKATALDPRERFADGAELANELALLVDRDLGDLETAATEAQVFEVLRADAEAPRSTAETGVGLGARHSPDDLLRAVAAAAPGAAAALGLGLGVTGAGAGTGVGAGGIGERARGSAPARAGVAVVVSDPIDPDSDVGEEDRLLGDAGELDRDVEATVGEAGRAQLAGAGWAGSARDAAGGGDGARRPDDENGGASGRKLDPVAIVHRSLPELRPPGWLSAIPSGAMIKTGASDAGKVLAPAAGAPSPPNGTAAPVQGARPDSGAAGLGGGTPAGGRAADAEAGDGDEHSLDAAASCFERGLALVASQNFEEARELLRRAIALDPQRSAYRTDLERLEQRMALDEDAIDPTLRTSDLPKTTG